MSRNIPKVHMPMQKNPAVAIIFMLFLLLAYAITTIGLMLLAVLLFKFPMEESAVSVGIIVIYILSTFLSSFICGKKCKSRKFIWGLAIGSAYFIVLLLLSLVVNESVVALGTNVATSLLICAGSGMLGGMLA